MRSKILWLGIGLLVSSCGDDKLAKIERLENLRILDVAANAPEVNAGDSITLTPYVSDSKGGGRGLSVTREACIDLGINRGGNPTCDGNPSRVILGTSTETPGTAGDLYTGAIGASTFNVPSATVMFTDPTTGLPRRSNDQFNGISYLFFMTVTAPDGETRTAFKRVIVSTRTTKNLNPVFSTILIGDKADTDPAAVYPAVATDFRLALSGNQAETYTAFTESNELVNRDEKLTAYWFVTEGDLSSSAAYADEAVKYSPLLPPPPGGVTFVGILKDDRGGTSIRIITK